MKRLVCSLMLLVGFAVTAIAQPRARVLVRGDREVVEAQLTELAAMPETDAKRAYGSLSVAEKADVWTLHLEQFLARHPELSEEQQSVIYEALGLCSAGLFEVTQDGPDAAMRAKNALARIVERAMTVMRSELVRDAFFHLASPEAFDDPPPPAPPGKPRTLRPVTLCINCTPPCNCANGYIFFPDCERITNPEYRCNAVNCTPTIDGCGALWLEACIGVCGPPL